YGYFEDITRWIASEQRLTALDDKLTDVIRSTSDWVWETDTDMRLTEVSARIAAITGAPPEAHLGKHVLSLGSLPDPVPGVPDLKLLMQDRRPFRNRLFIMRDETGQSRRIHLSGMPFFDTGNGRFLGYRGTGTDVTRALEAERDAISAWQKLEQALSALELRTPLNAISGFTELCRQQITETAGERIPSYLGDTLSAPGHLVKIIDNLLDTVRIENETTDMDLIEVVSCAGLVVERLNGLHVAISAFATQYPNTLSWYGRHSSRGRRLLRRRTFLARRQLQSVEVGHVVVRYDRHVRREPHGWCGIRPRRTCTRRTFRPAR
ncbi:MAG: histidine kinase dimerization/phospho-acceptor domain-containing protein, partial [Alphaproteobacteria bacterium]|nr:histidine kinase dimerization/phospho-acceptor domain-containing protein [Alphaproteobacteria bacterium]